MIDSIRGISDKHNFQTTFSEELFIVDYKKLNGGKVVLHEEEPEGIKYVFIENKKPIEIVFDGFDENALPNGDGTSCRQCECILFPNDLNPTNWILFIETKYANNLEAAFNENYNYPQCMIDQILQTVDYFRSRNIIPLDKKVNAIVSFPNLLDEFSSYFVQSQLLEIFETKKILIRATNSAKVISEKRIKLNSI